MSCCRPSHEQKRERPFAALRVTLLERCPGCHPERSAGSLRQARQTLRGVYPERSEWAQDDSQDSAHVLSREVFSPNVSNTLQKLDRL